MSEWIKAELQTFFTLKRGYDLPNHQRKEGKIPIISSSGITAYHNEAMKPAPGVITGRYGTIGEVFYSSQPYWPLNTTLYVNDFKGNHPLFIFYFLKNYDFEKFNDKSAVPGVNRNHVHADLVSFPSVETQQSIAEVLSSLDDKIDLLQRQNQTLEAMAETLFRQWFVEEDDTNWKDGVVSDLFVLQRGYDLPIQNRKEGKIPIVTSSGVSTFHESHKVEGPGIVTGRSGVIGNVFYIRDNYWPLNTTLYISQFKEATLFYSYFFLKKLDLVSLNAGSAVPTLNRNHVHELAVKIPPPEMLYKFEKSVEPMFEKKFYNSIQIQQLETLRDTLLPKLMSGAVRVRNKE